MMKLLLRLGDALLPVRICIVVGSYCLARLLHDPPSTYMGLDIFRFVDGSGDAEGKVRRALTLIATYEPWWIRQMKRKVRRIVIMMAGAEPQFRPIVRGCYVSIDEIAASSDEQLALTLIHEATHARLHEWIRASSFRPRPDIQERVERACVRREVAFAKKLPEVGQELAKLANDQLKTRWWEPARRAEARRKFFENL